MRSRSILVGLILLGWVTMAPAQNSALDLIPHDAGAALAVRNIKELAQKGEKLAKELNLRNEIKFSDLFKNLYMGLRVQGAVDEEKAAAILVISPKSVGDPPFQQLGLNVLNYLVFVVPFKDREQLGERLGFKKGELTPDKLHKAKDNPAGFANVDQVYVRGNYAYLGTIGKAVEYAATAKKHFGDNLTASQRKQFGQADVVLELGTYVWGKFWEDGILKAAGKVLGDLKDTKEKEMGQKIVKSMEGIRFGLAGLRLEKEGLHFNLLSAWDKDNKFVKEILGLLRYSDTPTDLTGLPTGNVLFAEAAKGNGVANAMLARVLFKASLQKLFQAGDITTEAERPMVVGVFNEIWYNLLGNKSALYQNAEPKQQGALTLVSILDTADGKKFFDHMAHLAQIADGGLKSGKSREKGTLDVNQVIKDLGGQSERKKDLALLKLRLLGTPALPVLKKAMKSENEELATQAKKLHEEIAALAAERKKSAPAGSWFLKLRPTLELLAKTEEREGATVHVMKLKLPKQAADFSQNLETLFGPQWDQVRFAIHGKNVVVLWGTNTSLLDETLKNLKESKAGLAATKPMQTFYKQSHDSRRVEMHFAAAPLMALFDGGPAGLPAPGKHGLSSVGLLVEPDSLQIDISLPLGEARLLAKLLNF